MNVPDQELLDDWLRMWNEGIVHIGDVVEVFERVISETGDAAIFAAAPQPLKEAIIADVDGFNASNTKTAWIKGSGAELNLTQQMKRLVEVLKEAGFVG